MPEQKQHQKRNYRCSVLGCKVGSYCGGLCRKHYKELFEKGYRRCSTCGEVKLPADFHKNSKKPDGINSMCKVCMALKGKDYRTKNPTLIREKNRRYRASDPAKVAAYARRKNLEREYGITPDVFTAILESQGGVCAICGEVTSVDSKGRGWHVDHNHKTGKTRGILCRLCNLGIGSFREDAKYLAAAIAYLETHNGG